jgi:uncharacterized Fe-S cluster-containing radical SAM superfamily protein
MVKEFWQFKMAQGCANCGYHEHGAALDFHHPDGNKEKRIMFSQWKTAIAQAEIAKCVLLCANCHRVEHVLLRDESWNDLKCKENGDVY